MNDGHLVVSYHGCDITTRDDLVAGRVKPQSSRNKYDWLGPGFYVFEGDSQRAEAFAQAAAAAPERRLTARPIATPSVVGCIFSVQRCLDMTTRLGLVEFAAACSAFEKGYRESTNDSLPINRPANEGDTDVLLRHLDNAVFTFIHRSRDTPDGKVHYQAVRGAFRQGPEISLNSGFHRDSHIQIALRDFQCIVGWFLPTGERLLSDGDYASAKDALDRKKAAHSKPRRRMPVPSEAAPSP
jgi:hypothetical protein